MQMDLRWIEAFAAIVRCGGLTQAETESGQSKATLSRQLARLEEVLGAQLFTRTGRKVVLTEAGRAFYAHCDALLAEISARVESARTQVQEMNAGGAGALSVLSDTEFSTTFVCHVARLFLEQHPKVVCRLDVAGRAHSPAVEDVDCYVCTAPPGLPNLVGKQLGQLKYGLYASADYIARRGAPATPAELAQHASILIGESPQQPVLLRHPGGAAQAYAPRAALVTNDYWVMKTFCIDGFGIALLPEFFAKPELEGRILRPVMPDWEPEGRRIYCAYQRQRYMRKKIRSFVDLMASCVADIDALNAYVATRGAGARAHIR